MVAPRKVLMLCGVYMQDYEAAVPLYALTALGIAVDCAATGKQPVGQGHLLLDAAGLLGGRKCASGVPMRVVSRLAGAEAVESQGAVVDGMIVTAASWLDLAPFVARVLELLGISVEF